MEEELLVRIAPRPGNFATLTTLVSRERARSCRRRNHAQIRGIPRLSGGKLILKLATLSISENRLPGLTASTSEAMIKT